MEYSNDKYTQLKTFYIIDQQFTTLAMKYIKKR